MPDGEPLGFDQDPPLVFPDLTDSITLRNFEVVGDYATVQFSRFDPDSSDGQLESWDRLTSRSVDGRVISIFEPQWSATQLSQVLSHATFGFDSPQLYWGALQIPGTSTWRNVYLRMGLAGVPPSTIVRLNDQVQYASNVVNLVIPGFGDGRVAAGTYGFELSAATQTFFQYFADAYDVLALVPEHAPLALYGAFHQNVQNQVRGLNLTVFNQSSSYGSAGALQGVEIYTGATATRSLNVNHEMAHQWGSNFDWTRIAGITRAGWQPSAHAPLWTGGETLIGAVLYGDRRARMLEDGYDIERTPTPIHYHPMEMYSMGAIGSADVPDFQVFADQGQFDPDYPVSPDVGTALTGETRPVSILDVIREHGRRDGPAPNRWRRATVLVSRDQLASPREMDYWNFFSQRLEDRNGGVNPTREGYVPFHTAARDAVTLSTAIQPLDQDPLPEDLNIDAPTFGRTDWRGVEFSSVVPTKFQVGQPVTLTGRIRATDPVDFNQILIGFYRLGVTDPLRFSGTISRSGDFSVTVRFGDDQRGQYSVGVFLFWPNSGPQYARTYLSSASVE
jgi:hypothetical protein